MASLCMAATLRGMAIEEIVAMTEAMVESGVIVDLGIEGAIDKHSTGGVADTVSLVAVPLVAACGIPVAKRYGRARGHTGGTLDKLEAIGGYQTAISPERFAAIVREVGCSIAAQSDAMVPADRMLYKLRDRTGTVPSIGLIAASIVSKKVAGGASRFVFDVKTGRGAFMQDPAAAAELARTLVAVSRGFGRSATALVTAMDQPLGTAIGTGLETIEAREYLRGMRRDPHLAIVVDAICRSMLAAAEVPDPDVRLAHALAGAGYERFARMVHAHGGSVAALEALRPHRDIAAVTAGETGFVAAIDPIALGELGRALSSRDRTAGIVMSARTGDAVDRGTLLCTVYGGDADDVAEARSAFRIGAAPDSRLPLVTVPDENG